MAGQGGAGDVLITVSIAPHPVFSLEGADVRLELPVTLYEAALGAKVRVPTLDKPVETHNPAVDLERAHVPSQGQGLSCQGRPRRSSSPRCGSCCPRKAMPISMH